ncbi:hypothetical protein HMSSN139_52790 [Paenibacillus sp. HMSSN-139]|nr:hypothetical protein HMSSN139_52790 [Paenibacillus sp. HMSSN-139]
MESLRKLANELAEKGTLITATISGRRKPGDTEYSKVQIKPVEIKKNLHYQFAYHYPNKVLHQNIPAAAFADELTKLFAETFRQGLLCTAEADFQLLISKKFKVTILKKHRPASRWGR